MKKIIMVERLEQSRHTVRMSLLIVLPAFGTILGMLYSTLTSMHNPGLGLVFLVIGFWACLLVIATWIAFLPIWHMPHSSVLGLSRRRSVHLAAFLAIVFALLLGQLFLSQPEKLATYLQSLVVMATGFIFTVYILDMVQRLRAPRTAAASA